jgi:hypothetical protein
VLRDHCQAEMPDEATLRAGLAQEL